MIVTGHSMGTWASWSVSAAMAGATLNGVDITPRATILQAGEIFKTNNNSSRFKYGCFFFSNYTLIKKVDMIRNPLPKTNVFFFIPLTIIILAANHKYDKKEKTRRRKNVPA